MIVLLRQLFVLIGCGYACTAPAQQRNPVQHIFPEGTVVHNNVPYASDTLQKHLLDLYLPPDPGSKMPLIIWVHGGAWMFNDKYADMGYMTETIRTFLNNGYALASIDYRHSTTAVFPAQIQDCNAAIQFLHDKAGNYGIDKDRFALIGFSAGGHLASLAALSLNNRVQAFLPSRLKPTFRIRCVLDYYGPSDFIAISSIPDTTIVNSSNPVSILLGAVPTQRPDLAKAASPVNYIDKNDPPFIIIQGEKDESVPNTQSIYLSSWLSVYGVKNELVMVPGAPHYGVMFDAPWIRERVMNFLKAHL